MNVKLFFLTILVFTQGSYANVKLFNTASLSEMTAKFCKEGLPAALQIEDLEDSNVIFAYMVCVPKDSKNKEYPIRITCQRGMCQVEEWREKTLVDFERIIQEVIKEDKVIKS